MWGKYFTFLALHSCFRHYGEYASRCSKKYFLVPPYLRMIGMFVWTPVIRRIYKVSPRHILSPLPNTQRRYKYTHIFAHRKLYCNRVCAASAPHVSEDNKFVQAYHTYAKQKRITTIDTWKYEENGCFSRSRDGIGTALAFNQWVCALAVYIAWLLTCRARDDTKWTECVHTKQKKKQQKTSSVSSLAKTTRNAQR